MTKHLGHLLCYLGLHRWIGGKIRAHEMWGQVRYDLPLRRYCGRCDEFYPLWKEPS